MGTSNVCASLGLAGVGTVLGAVLAAPAAGQVTQRVNLSSSGAQANHHSFYQSISADGRYVAFKSVASNLVGGDTNGVEDVFVRDRQSGLTARVSVDSSGAQGNHHSSNPSISADGRYVAFESYAFNLVGGDTNGSPDVFVYDRQTGTTERVSVDSSGGQSSDYSLSPSISADGRYVAFRSYAPDLVVGDTNGDWDVFVRDLSSGTTERVSVDSSGAQGSGESKFPSISADGRYVAFQSFAPDLVGGDTNASPDVFVRDLSSNTTERVSVDSGGAQGNHWSLKPSISADGRYVAFESSATNFVGGDTNESSDVFVHDRSGGTTEYVSVTSSGAQANQSSYFSSISADGRYVAFHAFASNLVSGDTNGRYDIFVRDRQSVTTERVSVSSSGVQANSDNAWPSISADGRYVAFQSFASNLVPGDTGGGQDVFVHDRSGGPSFTSLCDPGVGGVISCPCANPPTGPGRGCDNSSGTGGAILSASGGTYLSSDSLVFTTSGEKPTALSLLAQWIAGNATGVVFGQGVRCTSGTLKRLFSKNAVGGSITVPNHGAGDPTVSARSAAKGDTILAGQSRWYLVYYRDNTVLGACPPLTNFNATQTGQVTWSP